MRMLLRIAKCGCLPAKARAGAARRLYRIAHAQNGNAGDSNRREVDAGTRVGVEYHGTCGCCGMPYKFTEYRDTTPSCFETGRGANQETNQNRSARPRGRNTHGQGESPWPHGYRGRQAMTDDTFGGSSPKGNVVWVPTALPALATTLLDPSMVLIPIRKLFTPAPIRKEVLSGC